MGETAEGEGIYEDRACDLRDQLSLELGRHDGRAVHVLLVDARCELLACLRHKGAHVFSYVSQGVERVCNILPLVYRMSPKVLTAQRVRDHPLQLNGSRCQIECMRQPIVVDVKCREVGLTLSRKDPLLCGT